MPDPNSEADAGPAPDARSVADVSPEPDDEPGPRDRTALLASTPDSDAVADRIRTFAVLAGVLGLLVTLIAVELLVRI